MNNSPDITHLIRVNVIGWLFFSIFATLDFESQIGRYVSSLSILVILFPLTGLNLTVLISRISGKVFTLYEFLALTTLLPLLIQPFLLSLEHQWFLTVRAYWPILNSLGIGLSTFLYLALSKTHPPLIIPFAEFKRFIVSKTFILAFIVYGAIVAQMTLAYYPLPDLDPYYWLNLSRQASSEEKLPLFSDHRPLFVSLVYLFTDVSKIDFYATFKYVLPALLLLLIFPCFLLSSRMSRPLERALTLLLPFASGIVLIYFIEPIPQSLASIILFFSAAFLISSIESNNRVFFLLAGCTLAIGSLFHEALIFVLIIWFLASLLFHRREILSLLRSQPTTAILAFLLFFPYLKSIVVFLSYSFTRLYQAFLSGTMNWRFPLHYTNVDGNLMGWENLVGVSKYYAFYTGPAVLFVLILIFFARKKILNPFFTSPGGIVVITSSLLFLIIAEVLPRVIGLAFLPDRAWVFASALIVFLAIPILQADFPHRRLFTWVLIGALTINIGAALFINTLKRYTITEAQLHSAQWIKSNLPANRLLVTYEHSRLLQFYSSSRVIGLSDPAFFFNESVYQEALGEALDRSFPERRFHSTLQTVASQFNVLQTLPPGSPKAMSTIQALKTALATLEQESSQVSKQDALSKEAVYIYYAATDQRNPYTRRPYMKILEQSAPFFFDLSPERFERIYSDEEAKIFIWKEL